MVAKNLNRWCIPRLSMAHFLNLHITKGNIARDCGNISLVHTHALTLVMTENLLIPQRMLYQIPVPKKTPERNVCPRRVGVKESRRQAWSQREEGRTVWNKGKESD